MHRAFKIVDLFAGPGGLAEGFSAVRDHEGRRVFDVVLSVEKEFSAFSTLRLRAFTRQFDELPDAYYDYVAGRIGRDELEKAHPAQWQAAVHETAMLELGTPEAQAFLDPLLDKLRDQTSRETILIGGPPCQAYSLVGRARNRGVVGYDPTEDHRHFLYKEYIRILRRLEPVAFVMENVKGMLSSKVAGVRIVDQIVEDLRSALGFEDSYNLLPLVGPGLEPVEGNVIRSELFGIPQKRHRVILVGLRRDVAEKLRDSGRTCILEPGASRVTVADVLGEMPALRSGLSKSKDDPQLWKRTVSEAFRAAATACRDDGDWLRGVEVRLREIARYQEAAADVLPRTSTGITGVRDNRLGAWLGDTRLPVLPNHESRGHMEADLARYAFASTFAEVMGRSPKADEFPVGLAPDHRNWSSGKFADRFRVQCWNEASSTVTSHISKDGHYFIHPDPVQCRSLTVREAARLQTFPDNYLFEGNRTQQYVQVGNAVPPLLAYQIGEVVSRILAGVCGGAGQARAQAA